MFGLQRLWIHFLSFRLREVPTRYWMMMRRKQRCIVCQVHAPADNHFTFFRSGGKLCEADFIAQHLWLPTECCRAQRIFGGKPRTVTGSFHLSTDDSIPERSGGCYPPLQLRRQSRRQVDILVAPYGCHVQNVSPRGCLPIGNSHGVFFDPKWRLQPLFV